MNAPNFPAVLTDIRAVQADEAEQERSIAKRLAPLGWYIASGIGSSRHIYSPEFDMPIAKCDGYPPIRGKRMPSASNAEAMAKLIVDAVNTHDALCEALIEALPELREGYAKAMVIRALELAHAGSGLSDADLRLASDYLGGDGYAHIRDAAPEMAGEEEAAWRAFSTAGDDDGPRPPREGETLTLSDQLTETQLRG